MSRPVRSMRLRPRLVIGALAMLAACGRSRDDGGAQTRDRTPAERETAPGDAVITTPDNGIQLALAGDTVWMGLSDSVRTVARTEMDSGVKRAKDKGGLGGEIARIVTGTVDRALGTRVAYSLDEIEDVSYADGAIAFRYRNGAHALSFESVKSNNRPVLESFPPADAERFVAAVRARKDRRRM